MSAMGETGVCRPHLLEEQEHVEANQQRRRQSGHDPGMEQHGLFWWVQARSWQI